MRLARALEKPRRAAMQLCAAGILLSVSPAAMGSHPPGTAALNTVKHVVVVYPAGPGEDVERNRLSGERRAGFLHNLLGTVTEVAADDELNEAQLSSNLLLLGWGNRLLGTQQATRPFARTEDGRLFLGSIRVGTDQDLMFSAASPYDPAQRLFFWSRIDLELDTFSVLPFLGSDWAIYRGYEVIRQGMFRDRTAWPPLRDPAAEAIHEDFRRSYVAQGSSPHYTVHYPAGLIDEKQRDAILAAREQAFATAAAALGETEQGMRIELYLFGDAKEKDRLTGVPDPVHSLGRRRELHMLVAHARVPNAHEEIHLLARTRFGPSCHTALHEGLAMALEQPADQGDLVVYAAALIDQSSLPGIETVLDEEGVRVLNRRGLGFPAAGLLVRWLLELGGTELLAEIYSAEPLTLAKLAAAAGLSAEEADAAFRDWVTALADEGSAEYRFRAALAGARRLGQEDDWSGAVTELKRALAIRSDDVEALYRLGLAEHRAGQFEQAESRFRRIVESEPGTGADTDRYFIFAHYQLGQVLEELGRPDQARKQYRRMLALPDRYDSHRRAREALEKKPEEKGGVEAGEK